MKYRVIGWSYYGDSKIKSCDVSCAAYAAIVDDIRKNGWYFSGWDHQETGYGVPVLNDGKARYFSQRGWGGVMAEAYGYFGTFDYSLFAEGSFFGGERFKQPDDKLYPFGFKSEKNLNEQISVEVLQETFEQAAQSGEIAIFEEDRARYIDVGDTLIITCGDDSARYRVDGILKRRLVLPDGVQDIINKSTNKEEREAAVAIARGTPVTRWIRVKGTNKTRDLK